MELKQGGQLESFGKSIGPDEKVSNLNFYLAGENSIHMFIKSNLGNESITCLTLDEAVKLKRELQNEINKLTAL